MLRYGVHHIRIIVYPQLQQTKMLWYDGSQDCNGLRLMAFLQLYHTSYVIRASAAVLFYNGGGGNGGGKRETGNDGKKGDKTEYNATKYLHT